MGFEKNFIKLATSVRENERYKLYYAEADKIKIGMTVLKPNQETRGHFHTGVDEVYFFTEGKGLMELDEKTIEVSEGSVVLIPGGVFHRVKNTEAKPLGFVVAFNK